MNNFEENRSLRTKARQGFIWSAVERFSTQGIQFIFTLILARLLLPSDYGKIAMLVIFSSIANVLIDSGFSQALIQKQNRTQLDFSTTFYFNIVVGFVLYIVCFFLAPLIADFYSIPDLETIFRVTSIGLIINSFCVVQRAILTIRFKFREQAVITLLTSVVSGVVGVSLALNGYGVWSLVFQGILGGLFSSIFLWKLAGWLPTIEFSFSSFKQLFNFGSKLLVAGITSTIYMNLYAIVIGKKFSSTELGYFSRADNLAMLPICTITSVVSRVSYPAFCELQSDNKRFREWAVFLLKIFSLVVFPIMLGCSAISEPLINIILGDKWLPCAPLLSILCVRYMWDPVHFLNLDLLKAKGRSDLFLKLDFIRKFMGIIILIVTIPLGITAMCWGAVVLSCLGLVVNSFFTGRSINLGFFSQMKALLPNTILAVGMWVFVRIVLNFCGNGFLGLIAGIFSGVVFYICGVVIFQRPLLFQLLSYRKKS